MTRRLPRLDSATIRPPDAMSRAASWARTSSARAFVAITQSHCLGESSSPPRSTPDAALLTSTSRRPARRSTSATRRLISAGSLRSAGSRCAVPPRSSTSRAVFSAASRFTKKFTKTRAPASPKRSAIARPMPRPPPVTRTVRGVASLMAVRPRDPDRRPLELARERPQALGVTSGLRPRPRRLERVLERRRRDSLRVHRRRRLEHPGALARSTLAPDRELIARADLAPERDAREPAQPADLRELVAQADQELRGLREGLDDQRARQHGVARKMVGEHVLGRAHVLQRLDVTARLGTDDAVDEHEAHLGGRRPARVAAAVAPQVPGARRAAAASWPTMYSVTALTVRRFMTTSTASGECRFFSR